MKIVTINIPNAYLDCLGSMVNMGFFPSRSEAVRQAIKRFLVKEQTLNQDLEVERFEKIKEIQLGAMVKFA
jgi:Arc/MetJ-type ribon-helix-helix transcriptional regulator